MTAIIQAATGLMLPDGAPTPKLQAQFIISGLVAPTSHRPIVSMRLQTDGDLQKAEGSTAAALSYVDLPNNQWDDAQTITASDYEVYFDSTTNSMSGSGTWSGSARDTWLSCGTQRTWSMQKDTTGTGFVTHVIILEIREIANTSNTSGQFNQTFQANIEF